MYNTHYPKWTDDIHIGNNRISSPSVITIKNNNNKLYFNEDLIWLMDVEYYKRMHILYGEPIYLNNINVVNRTWNNSYSSGNGIFAQGAGSAPTVNQDGTTNPGSKLYQEFREMVKLKDIVGTFVWYILVGVIMTSKSYNYIISQPCSLNAAVAQKAVNSYIKNTVAAPKTQDKLTPDGFNYKLN